MKKLEDKATEKGGSRRRLIKALASGGAVAATTSLPTRWSQPVVDTVFIPAHAQTTPGADFYGTQSIAFTAAPAGGMERLAHIVDAVATPAHAGTSIPAQRIFELAAKITGTDTYEFFLKMTEIEGCPLNPSQPNEYSSFHTGSGTSGAGQSAPGTWCDGGTAPGDLTVIFHPDFLQAFGNVDGNAFSINLGKDTTVPVATPCIDCPPLA